MVMNIIPTAAVAASLLFGVSGPGEAGSEDPSKNIVEIAVSDGSFNTLVTAVKAAGLVETLSGGGPFTIFAPTDEAFAQIPEEKLNALLANKEALTAILTYHVISGKVMAEDVVKLRSAETVNGQSVDIKVWDGKVMIDDAQVITADVEASNGVIHVINKVILPDL
jgi:uncharacterized surface protein with fasciclin (FAS1) repeats